MMDPKEIYQEMLDFTSAAFWAGDFDVGFTRITFPGFVKTRDALLTYETREGYLPSVESMRESLINQGATAYMRICKTAAFVPDDPGMIRGTHTTYVLRGGSYVIPPYDSSMQLLYEDGLWKGNGITTDIDNAVTSIISYAHLRNEARQVARANRGDNNEN